MSLAWRILLAISTLVVAVTVALSLAVGRSWESAAEDQFEADFHLATVRLREQLRFELTELPAQLDQLCKHSEMVDATLTSLQAGTLDRERKYALSLLVPATQRAFRFDQLILLTSSGEILGAHQPGLIGKTDLDLAERTAHDRSALGRSADGGFLFEAHCRKAHGRLGVAL